ncbi:MAG TPA: hypothetical protein VFE62_18160 [Gemmataceae bacterium]|nr:hypothetical protein [Gemmataceae bacterium]
MAISKLAMAKRLVELGSDRSVSTLRQYKRELLEQLLAAAECRAEVLTPAPSPLAQYQREKLEAMAQAEPIDTEAQHILAHLDAQPAAELPAIPASVAPELPHLPMVPDGYSTTIVIPSSKSQPKPEASSLATALALLYTPILALRMIVGI